MPQYFKGDDLEKKVDEVFRPLLEGLSTERTIFFDEAYNTFTLGEVIWDSGRSPLANAIPRAVFREAFSALFESFTFAGTFESYLTVFRSVFGPDVGVEFEVPAPGKLNINIIAAGVTLSEFVARRIVDDVYVFDEIVDEAGDNIVFQSFKGLESEYELEQMLFEMVPAGIYTQISLTIG